LSSIPSFLDFEASSLSGNSYPIEVAWSLADRSIESHLVSPAGIEQWTDWSLLSQEVHGISRDELLTDGKSPAWICARMNDQLAGQLVYTDNPMYDGMWLAEMFSVARVRLKFKLGLIDELLFGRVYPNPAARANAREQVLQMKAQARERVGGQHRALLDVRYMLELYAIATSVDK